jgi:hypothetical protein
MHSMKRVRQNAPTPDELAKSTPETAPDDSARSPGPFLMYFRLCQAPQGPSNDPETEAKKNSAGEIYPSNLIVPCCSALTGRVSAARECPPATFLCTAVFHCKPTAALFPLHFATQRTLLPQITSGVWSHKSSVTYLSNQICFRAHSHPRHSPRETVDSSVGVTGSNTSPISTSRAEASL